MEIEPSAPMCSSDLDENHGNPTSKMYHKKPNKEGKLKFMCSLGLDIHKHALLVELGFSTIDHQR